MVSYAKTLVIRSIDEEFNKVAEKIIKTKLPKGFTDFALYVLSELIANVKEHAKAQKVGLRVKLDRSRLSLNIQDDGIGFRERKGVGIEIQAKVQPVALYEYIE